jgi:hypothetical protein
MFSRQSPSPRYQELLRQNRQLHLEGNPAQKMSAAAQHHPKIKWEVWYVSQRGPADDPEYLEARLGSAKAGS